MRVFIAALATETNAFSPLPATLKTFEQGVLFHGDATSHPSTLFTEALHVWRRNAEADGLKVIESLAAMAQPSGLVRRQTYEQLRDELLSDLRAAGPIDLVFLMLHGAMTAHGYDDCEGDIVRRARAIVGDQTRIGVLLDLHASVSRLLLEEADIVTACHLYPHTDFGDRAQRLYRALRDVARKGPTPAVAYARIDMLSFFPTTSPAMQELVDRMRVLEQHPDILAVSLIHGFPWSDTPDTGAGVIVATDANSTVAETLATELAERFALARHGTPQLVDVKTALDQVESAGPGLVVIADFCDNAGGGAPGDSTFLLDAMLRRDIGNAAVALLWDPEAVNIATDAGEGAQLAMRIGGKTAVTSGPPLDVHAEVVRIVESPHQRGLSGDEERLGRSVLLRIGRIQVVINSIRQQVFSPDCFTQLGVSLADQRVLVVKSSQHFARQFQPISGQFIYCETPGCLTFNFGTLPYRNLRRPMWPIDAGDPLIRTVLVERHRRP